MSGFGQDGPLADLPAFDAIVQARSGLVLHNGPTPTVVPGYLSDKVTAMFAVQAALAGLHKRSAEGRGSIIDISMLDSMAYFLNPDLLSGHLLIDNPEMSVADYVTAVRPLRTKDGCVRHQPRERQAPQEHARDHGTSGVGIAAARGQGPDRNDRAPVRAGGNRPAHSDL